MSKLRAAADRGAGMLRGAWDAARGTEYEPLGGRSEISPRERAVYDRWATYKPARNAYERAAYQSLPGELDAEMARAEQSRGQAEADQAAEGPDRDARDWDAFCRHEQDQEAGR